MIIICDIIGFEKDDDNLSKNKFLRLESLILKLLAYFKGF